MPVQIHRDGFILGGACHQRLNDRAGRERGARMAWDDAVSQGCVNRAHGWLRMTREPKERPLGRYGGGNAEIGWRRAADEIFRQLVEAERSFRWTWMERWLIGIAKGEFAIAAETPLGPWRFGLVESKGGDDVLYDKGHAKSYEKVKAKQSQRR